MDKGERKQTVEYTLIEQSQRLITEYFLKQHIHLVAIDFEFSILIGEFRYCVFHWRV